MKIPHTQSEVQKSFAAGRLREVEVVARNPTPPEQPENKKRRVRAEVQTPVQRSDDGAYKAGQTLLVIQAHAKRHSLCKAVVSIRRPKGETLKQTRTCGADTTRDGLCWTHYLRDVLQIPTGRPGQGKTMRPFTSRDIPWGQMSEEQIVALRELPVSTPLNVCLSVMNTAATSNPKSL